jgi:hypothetical protein
MTRTLAEHITEWAALTASLAALGLMILGAVRRERAHNQRLARYEAARRDAGHWDSVQEALPDYAGDLPSSYDPLIADNPLTPQRGEVRYDADR